MPTVPAFFSDPIRALDVKQRLRVGPVGSPLSSSTTAQQQELSDISTNLEDDVNTSEANAPDSLKLDPERRADEPAMLPSRLPATLIASIRKSSSNIRIRCTAYPQSAAQKPGRTLHSNAAAQPALHTSTQLRRRQQPLPSRLKDSEGPSHTTRQIRNKSTTTSPPKKFTYKLAAAYCGKSTTFKPNEHHFSFSSTSNTRYRAGIPLPDILPSAGRLASGQDAVFITNVGAPSNSNSNDFSSSSRASAAVSACAFGVADGVGGWQDQGIDSADFAHGICMYMCEGARYTRNASTLTPQSLLQRAYERLSDDASITGGGSTACLGIADSAGMLRVANLGDSGFMQLRKGKVQHYSDPQTHAFNTPYQLSRIPPKMLAQMETFGAGKPFSDQPRDAATSVHGLEHGDVCVFATDGVWDNLSEMDLLGVVGRRMEEFGAWVGVEGELRVTKALREILEDGSEGKMSLQTLLATDVVKVAKACGNDGRRDGPFAKAFQQIFPREGYTGGKPDDIAVVVAIAVAGDGGVGEGMDEAHGGVKL